MSPRGFGFRLCTSLSMGLPINPDVCRILSPAGLIAYPQEGGSGSLGAVAQPIPGQVLTVRRPTTYNLDANESFPKSQGFVDIIMTMGPVADGLIYAMYDRGTLSAVLLTSTGNQIQAVITDLAGTVVALTALPPAYNPGTTVHVTFVWDSRSVLIDPDYAVLVINGEVPDWDTEPESTWVPFDPTTIVICDASADLGMAAFNGTLQLASIGDVARAPASPVYDMAPSPVPVPWPGPRPHPWPLPYPWPHPRPRRRPGSGGGGIRPL